MKHQECKVITITIRGSENNLDIAFENAVETYRNQFRYAYASKEDQAFKIEVVEVQNTDIKYI